MSKLNPQKASAYVGPGVLRKGGKITPVPNGPLIKKKGPFKGSTLKTGGTIKKAQTGAAMTKRDSLVANIKEQSRLRQNLKDFQKKVGSKPLTPELVREKDSLKGLLSNFSTKQRVKGTGLTEQQLAKNDSIYTEQERRKKSVEDDSGQLRGIGKDNQGCSGSQRASARRVRQEARRKNGGPIKKAQGGTLLRKVADKIVSKGSNRMVDRIVKRPVGMTDKPVNYGKVVLTDAQKAKNAEILKNPGTATSESWARAKKIAKKESSAQSNAQYLERSNKPMITRPDSPKISTLARTAKSIKKNKAGGMIKRADGSMSRRGLWDNIRANKGSGKKPTKQMLVQEKKIKAKSKK